jgi:hypothetical protein
MIILPLTVKIYWKKYVSVWRTFGKRVQEGCLFWTNGTGPNIALLFVDGPSRAGRKTSLGNRGCWPLGPVYDRLRGTARQGAGAVTIISQGAYNFTLTGRCQVVNLYDFQDLVDDGRLFVSRRFIRRNDN